MEEETIVSCEKSACEEKKCCLKPKIKKTIFRFNSDKPTAINIENVTMMSLEDKRITFAFASNGVYVDVDTAEMAASIFEELLKAWAGD